jgi:hypothetical protein
LQRGFLERDTQQEYSYTKFTYSNIFPVTAIEGRVKEASHWNDGQSTERNSLQLISSEGNESVAWHKNKLTRFLRLQGA